MISPTMASQSNSYPTQYRIELERGYCISLVQSRVPIVTVTVTCPIQSPPFLLPGP